MDLLCVSLNIRVFEIDAYIIIYFLEVIMQKTKIFIGLTILFSLVILAAACNSGGASSNERGKVIATAPIGNGLTVTLSNDTGKLKNGEQEFMVAFTDASGKLVDVGSVGLNYQMQAMGSMPVMNDGATFTATSTPGLYKGKTSIQMAGEWKAQISYEGPAGSGKTVIPVTAY